MRVVAPASSANLGSGFDALGMAVNLPFFASDEPGGDLLAAEPTHPVVVACLAAGGPGEVWWRSAIPSGRGLGFSGAARVAGAYLAARRGGEPLGRARRTAYDVAVALEGHADNAAASAFGGLVVAAGDHVVPVQLGVEARVVVWSPESSTSTDASRGKLPTTIDLDRAVFGIGRAALLVAGLVAGDWPAIAAGTEDRIHQPGRLAATPASAAVLDALRSVAPGAAWLSGSGPSVAALVPTAGVQAAAAAASSAGPDGTVRILDLDADGAVDG